MTAAASSDEPVKIYYDSLEKLHTNIRRNVPFTFLSYKSMIPAKDDDFVVSPYKISYTSHSGSSFRWAATCPRPYGPCYPIFLLSLIFSGPDTDGFAESMTRKRLR